MRRRGFFRRFIDRIREIGRSLTQTTEPTARREPRPGPTREPRPRTPAPEFDIHAIDTGDWVTTESEGVPNSGAFSGDLATWTIAGWVTTNGDKHNSWQESENRDSDEPTDNDLQKADYVLVDIRVAGGTHVLPFVGPFPGGREELDQHVTDWMENDSPPGEWGAGGNYPE